jgi:predicted metal-dependent phosphoesterase TrpH
MIFNDSHSAEVSATEVLIDPHSHSRFSDGLSTPKSMFKKALARGLVGLIITDHDTVRHWPSCLEAARRYDMATAFGVELSTAQGHLLAYFGYDAKPRSIARALKLDEGSLHYWHATTVIKRIRELGGAAIIPHPFGPFYPMGGDFFGEVDGVEEYNAWVFKDSRHSRNAFGCGKKHHIAAIGGSDSHYPYTLGFGATAVPRETDFTKPDWWLQCVAERTTRPVVRQTIGHRRINYLKSSVSIPLNMRYNVRFWRSKWRGYWRANYAKLLGGGELLEKIRKEI